jgi:hypothetical protein
MSDFVISPSVAEILARNFTLGWNAALLDFTELKNPSTLRKMFETGAGLSQSDMHIVKTSIDANRVFLEGII